MSKNKNMAGGQMCKVLVNTRIFPNVAVLFNDDQMLTIENTDQSIKKYETYAIRMIDTKTTVLLPESVPRMTTPLKCC